MMDAVQIDSEDVPERKSYESMHQTWADYFEMLV